MRVQLSERAENNSLEGPSAKVASPCIAPAPYSHGCLQWVTQQQRGITSPTPRALPVLAEVLVLLPLYNTMVSKEYREAVKRVTNPSSPQHQTAIPVSPFVAH